MSDYDEFHRLADQIKAYRVTGFQRVTWELDAASAAKLELALRGLARWRKLVAETEARLDARQAVLEAQARRVWFWVGGALACVCAVALSIIAWAT